VLLCTLQVLFIDRTDQMRARLVAGLFEKVRHDPLTENPVLVCHEHQQSRIRWQVQYVAAVCDWMHKVTRVVWLGGTSAPYCWSPRSTALGSDLPDFTGCYHSGYLCCLHTCRVNFAPLVQPGFYGARLFPAGLRVERLWQVRQRSHQVLNA